MEREAGREVKSRNKYKGPIVRTMGCRLSLEEGVGRGRGEQWVGENGDNCN